MLVGGSCKPDALINKTLLGEVPVSRLILFTTEFS